VTQQTSIRTRDYRYQPREAVTRQIQQQSSTKVRAGAQAQQTRIKKAKDPHHDNGGD
jgi:hypothetical protein